MWSHEYQVSSGAPAGVLIWIAVSETGYSPSGLSGFTGSGLPSPSVRLLKSRSTGS